MGEFFKRSESSVRMKCRGVTDEEEDMQLTFSKKRKVYSELEHDSCGEAELAEISVSPATSRTTCCYCKHVDLSGAVKKSPSSPDLENADSQFKDLEMEAEISSRRVFIREATPTSELYGDSEHVASQLSFSTKKSTPPPTNLSHKSQKSANNMPSAEELEVFFAAAEKYDQKRFAEKYNYDIVKDVPLEGRYQWVRLLP